MYCCALFKVIKLYSFEHRLYSKNISYCNAVQLSMWLSCLHLNIVRI